MSSPGYNIRRGNKTSGLFYFYPTSAQRRKLRRLYRTLDGEAKCQRIKLKLGAGHVDTDGYKITVFNLSFDPGKVTVVYE